MATTIKLKNGSGAPAASDLVQGEPAIDLTNKRLYTENASGAIIEVGSNPSSLSINGTAVTATAAEINTLDGITSSTAELNILDGVTSTAAELNILDGVTATTAEINILDGVTSTTAELNILDGVTSTAAELNILDGVTATADELNILDGVTSTAAELNILDGVTATAAELNILDGVTSTTAELNILDGVTSTATELNILDGVTSSTAELNILDGVTSTTAELNILDGVTATATELNVLDGVTAFVDEDNMSSNSATSIPSQQSVKAYVDAQVIAGSGISDVVQDTTPQLGGDLDVNGNAIVSVSNGNIALTPNGSGVVRLDGNVDVQSGEISLKNSGSVSNIKLYCESSNAHYTQLQSAAHSAYSGNVTLTLPASTDTLVGKATTDTLTNKTLTSPDINTPDIDGGTIDGTVIGGSSAAAGTFSGLVANSLTYPTSDGSNGQAIVTNGSGTLSFATISGGGGGITYVTKTANYTMSAGEGVIANTAGGTFTITLPASPSTGDQVIIADGSNWATTNLTVGRNGSTIEGVAADLTCDVEGISVTMVYDGSTWQLYPQTGTSPSLGIDDNADAVAITIDSSENVGIGTTSPSGLLHLKGDTNTNGAELWLQVNNNNTTDNLGAIHFGNNADTTLNEILGGTSGSNRTSYLKFSTSDNGTKAERMRIDGSGNVGIGTTSPSEDLSIVGSVSTKAFSVNTPQGRGFEVLLGDAAGSTGPTLQTNTGAGFNIRSAASGFITLGVNAEHMRIDSSGNVGIGTTSPAQTLHVHGNGTFGSGNTRITTYSDSTYSGIYNGSSLTSNEAIYLGDANEFHYIGGSLAFQISGSHTYLHNVIPRVDNTYDIGGSSNRFDDIYATNSSIQTSDEREKQDIKELTEAEARVAVAAKALLRTYRWKDSVEAKDNNLDSDEEARIHFGIVAQDLKAAFEAEGLDAGRYGMFVHSTWTDEETDEERDLMGVRYSELLAFIIAAI